MCLRRIFVGFLLFFSLFYGGFGRVFLGLVSKFNLACFLCNFLVLYCVFGEKEMVLIPYFL